MADTKISQLPSATTPLAGAELVPLVQSGATVQTPTNELSKLTAATANTFTVKQVIEVTDNVNAALRITQLGTADALRVEDSTNPDSTPFIIDASGNVGIGGASTGTKLHVNEGDIYAVKSTGITQLTMTSGTVDAFMHANSGGVGTAGTASNHPLWLMTNNTQRAILGTDGSFVLTSSGGLGYGTGAGGTVTQTTNKNTAVTLNKTTGQITMASNNLAAGATATFNVNCDKVTSKDVVVVSMSSDGGTAGAYTVTSNLTSAGVFNVRVTNVSGGALAEAAVINFAIIKGANA